jgi:putative copper resistance protein D
MEKALIAVRFMHFTASLLAFCISLFRLYALPATSSVMHQMDQRLVRTVRLLAIIGLITAILWLGLETAQMYDSFKAAIQFNRIKTVLFETTFGHAWIWHLGFGVLLIASTFSRTPKLITILCATFFLVTLAFTGHAMMESGRLGSLHRLNQTVHLLAAGTWIGGLLGLSLLLYSANGSNRFNQAVVNDALLRFSGIGCFAVGAILISGAVNTWFMVSSVFRLMNSDYGITLMIKFMFVAIMIALAVINRFVLVPNFDGRGEFGLLKITIMMEQIFALLVVMVVSILGTLPPIYGMG